MNYGAGFCRGVEPFLANLKALLDTAADQGMSGHPDIVSAQAVYDDVDGVIVYLPIGSDCDRHTREVRAAIARATAALAAVGASTIVPRPDAEAPPEGDSSFGIPTWAKWAGFGVLGVVALHYLGPIISGFAPRRKMAGYRRRR